ncbi:hypothetical protein [Glycomyces albidus]|uniref:Matrixin family metalloprotease n=1 Tax=Glycomyces albidus TaxID=2656774 RepID=A0A6L5GAB5_9ACTN|nr:hypothetical protein [Glycomyces albidus]MQM26605.1 hypothetical protein [Glycomyces albidus]
MATPNTKRSTHMRSSTPRMILIAAAAFALLAALAAPARAGHSGDSGIGNPDSKTHCLEYDALTSDGYNASQHGRGQLQRSVMTTSMSCDSLDVRVHDGYYGTSGDWNGLAGMADCLAYQWWSNVCEVYRVRYNLTYAAGYSDATWDSLGCHELGHTAGLGHRTASNDTDNNSCMRSSVSSSRPRFDTHDVNAIDALW